ncbi:MAG: fimbrillin family protein [Bacteroidales bacterium]|nr:fimbrillin family protein [Bacteroidales bacterium]
MKKYFLLASIAMLFACCNDELNNASEIDPIVDEEAYLDPEPVVLGAFSDVTLSSRATILEKWGADDSIGIFGLCSKATLKGAASWEDTVKIENHPDNQPAILKNVRALPVDTTITFGKNVDYYYPRQSTRNYRFYGYYPYSYAYSWDKDAKQYYVTGKFDGQTDILAGTSEYTSEQKWNAKFIREQKQKGDSSKFAPKIEFKHMTAQLQVLLKQGDSFDASKEYCQIDSIYLMLPNKYKLIIADEAKATYNYTSKVLPQSIIFDKNATKDTCCVLKPYEDITASGAKIGNYNKYKTNKYVIAWPKDHEKIQNDSVYNDLIFVPAGTSEYTINIIFKPFTGSDGKPIVYKTSAKIVSNKFTGNPSTFKAGTAYRVVLTINGLSSTRATVDVAKWQNGGSAESDCTPKIK